MKAKNQKSKPVRRLKLVPKLPDKIYKQSPKFWSMFKGPKK